MHTTATLGHHAQPHAGSTRDGMHPRGAARLTGGRTRRVTLAIVIAALFLAVNAIAVVQGWSPFQLPGEGSCCLRFFGQ